MVTTGSSAAFVLGFIAAFDAGDRVAIATPGYPCYRNILEALGVEVVSVPVDASTNFQPTPALLDAVLASDPRPLKGLIVASPLQSHRHGALRVGTLRVASVVRRETRVVRV